MFIHKLSTIFVVWLKTHARQYMFELYLSAIQQQYYSNKNTRPKASVCANLIFTIRAFNFLHSNNMAIC